MLFQRPQIYLGLMCYFLYWLIQFPLLFISPQKIRYFFNFKCVVVPAAYLSILIWAAVKTPLSITLEPLHTKLHGSELSWAWLGALNSALGSYATLAVNIPDFTVSGLFCITPIIDSIPFISDMLKTRERTSCSVASAMVSNTPRRQLVQLIAIPASFTLTGFIGGFVSNCTRFLP